MGFCRSELVEFLNCVVLLGLGLGTRVAVEVGAQQIYQNDTQYDCGNNVTDGTFGYACNGEQRDCEAYALYRAQVGYRSVSQISALLDSDASQMANINNVGAHQILDIGREIIAPINCSCAGNVSQTNGAYYSIKNGDTYYLVSTIIFEGLAICRSIILQNPYDEIYNLGVGDPLRIPLRCACPTRQQAKNGVKYLLTYLVTNGDSVASISTKFNVSAQDILDANQLHAGLKLFSSTPILVPLTEKPVSFASTPPKGSNSSSSGLRIGIGVGIPAFVLAVGAIAVYSSFIRRGRFLERQGEDKSAKCNIAPGAVEKFLKDYANEMPTRYSYREVKRMTNGFSHKLGQGGFGVVYKGMLSNGTPVAAKLLDQSRHSEVQFMNEVATLGRIHHVHLVRLLGFCFDGSRTALLYEYMPNGSLDKFIFAGKPHTTHTLDWQAVYSVALGAARGIAYLHTDCEQRIIHLDIKPHNILLDANFSPKVSDFGLAKLSGRGDDHLSMTAARGTPGYAAPEIWFKNWGHVTDKSDVYSFGMLLLELVGGRKNVDSELSSCDSQFYFPEWIFHRLQNGEAEGFGGRALETEKDKEIAIRMTKVGLWCIQQKSSDRPSMNMVVQMLEGTVDDIANPPLPFDSSTATEARFEPSTSGEHSS